MESIEEKKITIENNSNESFSFKNETKITEKTEINNYENEWEKIELNIKKNNNRNLFNKSEQNSLKNSLIKTIDWDDFDEETTKNTNSFLNKVNELNLNFQLKNIIHPIDNSFEEFTNKKIQDLEKLKIKIDYKIFSNDSIKEENEITNTYSSNFEQKNNNELPDYSEISIIQGKNCSNLNIKNNNLKAKGKTFLIDDNMKENKHLKKINKFIGIMKNQSNDDKLNNEKKNLINDKLKSLYDIILIKTNKSNEDISQSFQNEKKETENSKDYFEQIFENIISEKVKNIPLKKRSYSFKEISFLKNEEFERKKKNNLEKFIKRNIINNHTNLLNIPNHNPKKNIILTYQKNFFPEKGKKLDKSNQHFLKKIKENKRLLNTLFSKNIHS